MPPWFPSSDLKRTSLLTTVTDLGLTLTLMLTFEALINHHCKVIVYHLRNIARIWAIRYTEKLVHWFKLVQASRNYHETSMTTLLITLISQHQHPQTPHPMTKTTGEQTFCCLIVGYSPRTGSSDDLLFFFLKGYQNLPK